MAFNQSEYEKLAAKYADLRDKGAEDRQARKDKNKPFQEMRSMELEAAKLGINATGGHVSPKRGPTKQSMQEEYVRRFEKPGGDDTPEPVVTIIDKAHPADRPFIGTRADFHRKRLGIK